LERISEGGGQYCPKIAEPVKSLSGKSFDELFLQIMDLLKEKYGGPNTTWVGQKSAWIEQMIKPLSRTFPNLVSVNIIRDPRAVVASNYKTEKNRYPLLLNLRDWRKSICYTWKYKKESISSRFTAVLYEDLVKEPKDLLSEITDFLKLDYSKDMVSSSIGEPNTGYQGTSTKGGISSKFLTKWKSELPKYLTIQIEHYCSPEMKKTWL